MGVSAACRYGSVIMRLEEACRRFNELAGTRFGDLFSPADMNMIIINKGKTGQLLELSLGMHLSSTNLDFDAGELKTSVMQMGIQERPFSLRR